jgi:esterase/lipase superfamily enzyme
MYMVSCRKGFTDNLVLSKQNQYRNYSNPGDPGKFQKITQDVILKAAQDKHVLVLVHGYNNPMENVLSSYWDLVKGLQDEQMTGVGQYGLIIGFTWPGMLSGVTYLIALATAKKSAPFLRDFIATLQGVAHSVDVQTHSLGARVALKALADPKKAFVDNLMLTAAAVDNNLLEPDKEFFRSTNSVNRCFSYHSTHDPVLAVPYLIGDLPDGINPALGFTGPRNKNITLKATPNVYVVDCSARIDSHGGYRSCSQYYDHWKLVLAGGPMNRYDELS